MNMGVGFAPGPFTQIVPTTDNDDAGHSWQNPQVAPGVSLYPMGYAIFIGRSDGYHGIPGASMYKKVTDKRIMGDGQTPTPLLACYALHEQDPNGQWNAPPGQLGESQPMHGFTGINAAQIDGSVIFKPFTGQEVYGFRGDAKALKFYLFPSPFGGNDALAF